MDINQVPITNAGFPTAKGLSGANYYIVANGGATGTELYVTNALATPGSATLLKDIRVGTSSGVSSSTQLIAYGGGDSILFEANDGTNGEELWTSDGTAVGTTLVKDIRAGSGGSSIDKFTLFAGEVYFRARDAGTGTELWKTDGTAIGTVQVKDIAVGSGSSSPNELVVFGGSLCFSADEGTAGGGGGRELWVSDGTTIGTVRVTDLNPGSLDSLETSINDGPMVVNGALYFTAQDGTNGKELWTSDGTAIGTSMVTDLVTGSGSSDPRNLTAVGTSLFMTADNFMGTDFGIELNVLDTTAVTPAVTLVKDIQAGSGNGNPQSLTHEPFTGLVYFIANDGSNGTELWVSDGSSIGTYMVKDIRAGSGNGDVKTTRRS